VSVVSAGESNALIVPVELACGVAAGPLFVGGFTTIGARRPGYDWRRHAVSSLAAGRGGWSQRANFVLAGALYRVAARGLARKRSQAAVPRVVPALVFGVGAGLVGSGVFVTDPVAGFPPSDDHDAPARTPPIAPTREGELHNLCAVPIFAGIPVAAVACAVFAARRADYRWASYSAGSAVAMTGAFALFASAFGGAPSHAGRGGLWQRISVATGFGWLTALSVRTLTSVLPGS
jgi:hypothetical protein